MSDYLNEKYHLEMEILSPLHVGAGQEKDWMKGADYVIDEGKLYKLNHKKLLQRISAQDLANILLTKDENALKRKISGDIAQVADEVFDAPVNSDNDIKSFIKNGLNNKPIVPGSSLKGAIRSIILNHLLNGNKPNRLNENEVFGDPNKGNEFMRFIKISDAQFEETELVNTKVFNLFGMSPNLLGGWKHSFRGGTNANFKQSGFNTIYEVIQPSQTGELTIALAAKALDNLLQKTSLGFSKKEEKIQIINQDITQKLFAIINFHTKEYIKKQIIFFEKYSNNETGKIIESLNNLLQQIPDDNSSCVLKMAAGSGFHSITGDWQFDDFSIDSIADKKNKFGKIIGHIAKKDGNISAKSRKIATDGNKFEMMGFVKLTALTDEIIAEREAERKEKLETDQKIEEERIRKERKEQQRIEAERLAKIEAERKAEEERIAREKRKQEERIAEEKREQEEREALIKQKQEDEKQRQEKNIAKKEAEFQKLQKEGLAKLLEGIDAFDEGKSIIANYKKKLGNIPDSEYEVIKLFLIRAYKIAPGGKNRWSKIKKTPWNLISSWLGPEISKHWFDEITKK